MEDIDFKLLQSKAVQERWKKLADKNDWDSILQLTTERIIHIYEAFKDKAMMNEQGEITTPKNEQELLIGLQEDVLLGNTICACHSLLKLIQTLDSEVTQGFYEREAIEDRNYKEIKLLKEESKLLRERIEKLEVK